MGSKKAEAPDYKGAAEAQAASSERVTELQTRANRPTQITPWGTSTWTEGGDGLWTQNINLSGPQQQALDDQMRVQAGRSNLASGLIGNAANELAGSFNWGSLPGMGGTPQANSFMPQDLQRNLDYSGAQALNAGGNYNPDFAQTQYQRQMSLEGPQMERELAAMDTRLRNQGLRPGTEAYDNAIRDLRNQQGERMGRMSQDAMMLGASEQERQFQRELAARQQQVGEIGSQGSFYNMSGNQMFDQLIQGGQLGFQQQLQAANYQNALRQQAIAEEAQRRGMSINEMNALLTGQQVGMPSMPGFTNAAASEATNYSGAAQAQGDLNMANAANATSMFNSTMGALGSFGMSDRRLKKNIRKVGELPNGISVYRWEWKKSAISKTGLYPQIGVIAQEVKKVIPEAVFTGADGFMRVVHGRLA